MTTQRQCRKTRQLRYVRVEGGNRPDTWLEATTRTHYAAHSKKVLAYMDVYVVKNSLPLPTIQQPNLGMSDADYEKIKAFTTKTLRGVSCLGISERKNHIQT